MKKSNKTSLIIYLAVLSFVLTACSQTTTGPEILESEAMDNELSTQTELSTSTEVDALDAELEETLILEDDFSDLENE